MNKYIKKIKCNDDNDKVKGKKVQFHISPVNKG